MSSTYEHIVRALAEQGQACEVMDGTELRAAGRSGGSGSMSSASTWPNQASLASGESTRPMFPGRGRLP